MNPLRYCLVSVVALALAAPVMADAPYSAVVVFGDSTVDTGNLYLASEGAVAGPPYLPGRFSNGPVWVEVLAARLGLGAPKPSLGGGTNYAWGGAGTGGGSSLFGTPNLGSQVGSFLADRGGLAGDELVVISAGVNDIAWQAPYSPRQVARNIANQIARLAAAGGRTFLVASLAPYGQAPEFRGTNDEHRIDALTAEVNKLLDRELQDLEDRLPVTVLRLDVARVIGAMLDRPDEFGLANVTDPACPGCGIGVPGPGAAGTLVPDPDEYLWWDFIHWTWVVQELIGELAAELTGPEAP
jgi:phospholipase/lecithinase/hemolysin